MTFRPGDAIAWRVHMRDMGRAERLSAVLGMTVVQDDPSELAIFRRPGYPFFLRDADWTGPERFRHRAAVRFLETWRDNTWRQWRVLVLKRPTDDHAISLFWDDAS